MKRCRSSAVARLATAVLLILAATPAWADDFGGRGTQNPLPCECSDVDPRESFVSTVPYTCWEQYKFGSCNQSFIMESIMEVSEGYCQISCGRCSCCPTLAQAALAAGLTEFWWAINRSSTNVEPLDQPGLIATVLAPDDSAMRTLFDRLGGKAAIESDEGVRAKLANIMSYHVVRPVEGYEAFTTPFMAEGTVLQSFKNGSTITVESNSGGNIKLAGAGSSADINQKDMYACKGFINVLNWYLLPPGESL